LYWICIWSIIWIWGCQLKWNLWSNWR